MDGFRYDSGDGINGMGFGAGLADPGEDGVMELVGFDVSRLDGHLAQEPEFESDGTNVTLIGIREVLRFEVGFTSHRY